MTPQPVIGMIPQRHVGDCGVAALAMFLGVSYEDALLSLGGEVPTVLRRGVWMSELQRAAERLGVPLTNKRRYDVELEEGILQIVYRKKDEQHVVVLREGLIFETNLDVWRVEDYCTRYKARLGALLVRED